MIEAQNTIWKKPHYVGYGFAHFFVSALGQSFLLGMFKPYIAAEFGFESDEYSTFYSIVCLISGFTLPWVGPLIDRFKLRNVSIIAGLVLIASSLAMSMVNSALMFFVVLFGIRFTGQAFTPLIASTGLARYFTKHRGKAISFAALGLSFSEIVFSRILIEVIERYGWREAWLLLAAVVAVFFLPVVFFLVKPNSEFHLPIESSRKSAKRSEVLRNWRFYVYVFNYIFSPFVMTGYFILTEDISMMKGWEVSSLLKMVSIYGVVRVCANFLSGPIIDYFTGYRVFKFSNLPILVGLLILLLSDNFYSSYLFIGLFGISVSIVSASATATWAEIYGPAHLGSIKSVTSTGMVLATSLGSFIFGKVLSTATELDALFIPLICVGICLSLAVLIVGLK